MDENTQEIVRALSFNHSLALTSTQADIIKHTKQYAWTRHLHYYDNPNSDPPEYCSLMSPPKDDHDNLLYAIKNFTINFESRPKFHLLMLVHLLQDLHQPLHLSGKSRGGNGVMITLPNSRRQVSLHEYWDTIVIHQAQSETNGKLLEYVTTAARYMTCDENSPERWARETERINCELVWTDPTDPSYHERATNVAIHLLIRASIRTKCYLTDVLSKKKMAWYIRTLDMAESSQEDTLKFYDKAAQCPWMQDTVRRCPWMDKQFRACPYLNTKFPPPQQEQVGQQLPPITNRVTPSGLLVPHFDPMSSDE